MLKREWFAKKAHSYFVSNQGKKRSRCSASPSIFNAGLMQNSTCSFANHLRLSIILVEVCTNKLPPVVCQNVATNKQSYDILAAPHKSAANVSYATFSCLISTNFAHVYQPMRQRVEGPHPPARVREVRSARSKANPCNTRPTTVCSVFLKASDWWWWPPKNKKHIHAIR